MKSCFTLALALSAICAIGQSSEEILAVATGTAVADTPDRLTLVKNSMQLSKWHEQPFWNAYELYKVKEEELVVKHTRNLVSFARQDESVAALEAFNFALKIVLDRYEQIALWEKSFSEITISNNGAVALKFLQTETLLTMMDISLVYEDAAGYRPYRPLSGTAAATVEERREAVAKALMIPKEKQPQFFSAFDAYEIERVDLLGEDYSMYDLYVGDPADFTPAFSKRLGRDFIEVMKRELKLKEKYLSEIARVAGPAVAARFLLLEDYQSTISKMYVWTTSDDEGMLADGSH